MFLDRHRNPTLLVLAAFGLLTALLGPTSASAQPRDRAPADYYVFRTLDTGEEPTAEQDRRCDEHFGAAAAAAVVRLNAFLYSFEVAPRSGLLTDQIAEGLGPGFICGAPTPGSTDPFEAFAFTGLPGLGEGDAAGRCAIQPVLAQPGNSYFNCRLGLIADRAIGLRGGLVTSNSIVNPGELVPGAPTGSVWTARPVVARDAPKPPPVDRTPPGAVEDPPGISFRVARSAAERRLPAGECEAPADRVGRDIRLRSTRVGIETGRVPDRYRGEPIGSVRLCLGAPAPGGRRASAIVRIGRRGERTTVTASGTCSSRRPSHNPRSAQQGCGLNVDPDAGAAINGGLLTSNRAVRRGAPARGTDRGVFTLSLIED